MGNKKVKSQMAKLLLATMLVLQLAGAFLPAQRAAAQSGTITIAEAIEDASAYLQAQSNLSDWDAYALWKAGKTVPSSYLAKVTQQIRTANGEYSSVTDYARIALGIRAAGGDATSIPSGSSNPSYNLIEKIYNNDKMKNQGSNGLIYSLLALDAGSYVIPGNAVWTQSKIVTELLGGQNADGGWCCTAGANASGVDMTAAALAALAPYKSDPAVQAAGSRAVAWLQSRQLSNGGYNDGGENAESTAQVIFGLSAWGIDAKSGNFTKPGGDPLTYLFGYRQNDGGFAHLKSLVTSSVMATNQSLQALAAYHALNADGGVYEGSRRPATGPGNVRKAFAKIHVEGPNGIIAEGAVEAANVYEGLTGLLTRAGYTGSQVDIADSGWINSIAGYGPSSDWSNYWAYNVKRQDAWDFAGTGSAGTKDYALQDGDDVYVYYFASSTQLVDSVTVGSTENNEFHTGVPAANNPFQVKVTQILAYSENGPAAPTVADNVYVSIGSQRQTTNAGGIAAFTGLNEGSYTLTVSAGVYNGAPKLVSFSRQLDIGIGASVSLQVEGPQAPIATGTAKGVHLQDALTGFLTDNHIGYEITSSSYGNYIKTINGFSDYWNFAVWRQGELLLPQVSMADFELKPKDKVIVYYGGFAPPTGVISSVELYPALPADNEPFSVIVQKQLYNWQTNANENSPASGVQVQIGSLIATTNEQGVATFRSGVNAGSYSLAVTGYVPDSTPKVARAVQPVVIGTAGYASVAIEGLQKTFAAGTAAIGTDATVAGAIKSVLDANNVSYVMETSGYGPFLKKVENLSFSEENKGVNGWSFAVKHNGKWDYSPMVGIGEYMLQSGDQLLVYYLGLDPVDYSAKTFVIDSVASNPETIYSGNGFGVSVKKGYYDFGRNESVTAPAAAVQVQVGDSKATTDESGVASFNGVTAGTYPVTVTGYVYDQLSGAGPSKVIRSVSTLTVLPQPTTGGGGTTPPGPSVTISVEGDDSRGTIVSQQKVDYQSGDNPYTVLTRVLGTDRVETKGTGSSSIYVSGIDGLHELDKGAKSGWVYAVNCTVPGIGAGSYSLRSGDRVDWRYTINNGDDIKASISSWCVIPAGSSSSSGGSSSVAGLPELSSQVLDGISRLSFGYGNMKADSMKLFTVSVLNESSKMSLSAAQQLRERLKANQVELEQAAAAGMAQTIGDAEGEVKLRLPSNALRSDQTIGIRKLDSGERTEAVSGMFEFSPSGAQFDQPVYISITAPLDIEHLDNLALVWLNEETGEWIPIPAAVDAATGIVTGAVNHFTKFAVVDKTKLGAAVPVKMNKPALDLSKQIQNAVNRVLADPDISDWEAYALGTAGQTIPASYLQSVENTLNEKQGNLRLVTDYERMALGVKAAGGNPQNIAGIDLIEKIYNNDRMTAQGVNGPIFAVMTLQNGRYAVPASAKWSLDSLIKWVVERQNADGSWSLDTGDEPNVDLTGMALIALSGLQDRPEVKAAANKALAWLSAQQTETGGFKLVGLENSESAAWALMAGTAYGIPAADARFTKSGGNTLTHLLGYQQADGGFAHTKGDPSGDIPTEQALLALAMYQNAFGTALDAGSGAAVSAAVFTDASDISGWARDYVQRARQYGLMEGVEANRFEPKKQLTRAELVALVLRLMGEKPDLAAQSGFADVKPGSWYGAYIAKAAEKGIVQGVTSQAFAPENTMSRQDMAIVLARAFNLKAAGDGSQFKDISQAYDRAELAISAVQEFGFMEGDEQGNFQPNAGMTREMAAAVAVRVYEKKIGK
ncbi:S-layer homology domain-containing protein [Paenibacillus thalictri]|nr:S-layer homology domain-containing protein [Paenibacillus thalictri]